MSAYIDTSDGTWREVSPNEWANNSDQDSLRIVGTGGGLRHWLRKKPVPPLPTEPGYYLDQDGCAWRLGDDGEWDDTFGNPIDLKHRDSQPKGLLVRLEPRAETAKAVIDRVRAIVGVPFGAKGWPEVVGNEFGVTA